MKLYKDGEEAYVEKDQVPMMLATGWNKNPELVSVVEEEEDSDDSKNDESETEVESVVKKTTRRIGKK